jgi:hypothetical protein
LNNSLSFVVLGGGREGETAASRNDVAVFPFFIIANLLASLNHCMMRRNALKIFTESAFESEKFQSTNCWKR